MFIWQVLKVACCLLCTLSRVKDTQVVREARNICDMFLGCTGEGEVVWSGKLKVNNK